MDSARVDHPGQKDAIAGYLTTETGQPADHIVSENRIIVVPLMPELVFRVLG